MYEYGEMILVQDKDESKNWEKRIYVGQGEDNSIVAVRMFDEKLFREGKSFDTRLWTKHRKIEYVNTCHPYSYGEKILVKNNNIDKWVERTYIGPGESDSVLTVLPADEEGFKKGKPFSTSRWSQHKKKQKLVRIGDKEVPSPILDPLTSDKARCLSIDGENLWFENIDDLHLFAEALKLLPYQGTNDVPLR